MLIYCYLFIFIVTCATVDVKLVSKRSDIDVQTCIENFDIHKDKIIRTQDSRSMGAKYLNEIDLDTREECLRLCCETDTCDVFVYEEKSSGSCYLFHCGPPEDFKCKFTRHANYSSAVLTINRHLNELENQIKLTKHEQDLTRLRKPEETRQPEVNMKLDVTRVTPSQLSSSTTPKTKALKDNVLLDSTKPPTISGRRCSRYQFECRSSGECIAIYNACDGIPQCADGSDEAPELGCPESVTVATLSPHSAPPPPPPPIISAEHPSIYENQMRKPIPPMLPNSAYQQSAVAANARVAAGAENVEYARPQVPEARAHPPSELQPVQSRQSYAPAAPPAANNWLPQQNGQLPVIQQTPQFPEQRGIFQHKGSGLQVQDAGAAVIPDRYRYHTVHTNTDVEMAAAAAGRGNAMQYGDMNIRNEYQKIPNYYGDIYRQQYPVPDNWPPNTGALNGENNPYVNNDNWQPVQVPQTQNMNEQTNQIYRQNVEVKPNWKSDLIDTQAESKSFDHTIIHEEKQQEHKSEHKETPDGKPNVESSNSVHNNDKLHHKVEHIHVHLATAEKLQQNSDDLQDGEAERPGGAILSLTLGVSLTCVMAILIGCRLRVVRRRMRRGGKSPYAHDADYLVNGMYL